MDKAFDVLKKINRHGFSAFLVGGSVRDRIMGYKPVDFDITTNAKPEEIKDIFPDSYDTGITFGTVTVRELNEIYEITTFRVDSNYDDNRKPSDVTFINDLNLDLSRRDFTMNAMALDHSGLLFDPYNGKKDIESGLIKTVGDPIKRFSEDSLRMLRAIRFSCQLGFKIESVTFKAIQKNSHGMRNVSIERITNEIIKSVNSKYIENLTYLFTSKLASNIDRRSQMFDPLLLKRLPARYNFRLFGFLYLSSINTSTLSLSKKVVNQYVNYFQNIENNRVFLKKILQTSSEEELIKILFFRSYLENSDFYLRALEQVRDIIKFHEPYKTDHLVVDGNDLISIGIKDGVEIGKILAHLLDKVMLHPEKNKKDFLKDYITGTFLHKQQ